MTGKTHHIQIGTTGDTWCDWTGSQAGQDIMKKTGPVMCSHSSAAAANRAATLLRPHFKRGRVKIVAGECQHG